MKGMSKKEIQELAEKQEAKGVLIILFDDHAILGGCFGVDTFGLPTRGYLNLFYSEYIAAANITGQAVGKA